MDGPHAAHTWSKCRERFQALGDELIRETRDAGEVPRRVRGRFHDARGDGITDEREDDRNGLRHRPCRERRRFSAREDHVHARLDQRVGGSGNLFGIRIGEPDVEEDVATFFESEVPKTALEPVDRWVIGCPRVVQHTDKMRPDLGAELCAGNGNEATSARTVEPTTIAAKLRRVRSMASTS